MTVSTLTHFNINRWKPQFAGLLKTGFRYIDFDADNPPNDKVRLNDNRGDYVRYAQFVASDCFVPRNFDSLNQTFLKNEPFRLLKKSRVSFAFFY